MKTRSTLVGLLCAGCLLVPPSLAGQELEAEPNHTTIGFVIPIAGGLTRVTGKFTQFDISVNVEKGRLLDDVTAWTVTATIATASIDTGIEARDKHLRTADFFDAETYPEIVFTSERIERSGEGYAAVGTFDMHGVKKPFRLPFTITGSVRDEVTKELLIGIEAHTTLLRSDYDVAKDFQHTHMKDFLGDEITIEIYTWLQPPQEKEAKDAGKKE